MLLLLMLLMLPQYLLQTMTPSASSPIADAPADTVKLPSGNVMYMSKGVEIEGDDSVGVDVQYWWETSPRKEHYTAMTVGGIFLDKYPVTCSKYQVCAIAISFPTIGRGSSRIPKSPMCP